MSDHISLLLAVWHFSQKCVIGKTVMTAQNNQLQRSDEACCPLCVTPKQMFACRAACFVCLTFISASTQRIKCWRMRGISFGKCECMDLLYVDGPTVQNTDLHCVDMTQRTPEGTESSLWTTWYGFDLWMPSTSCCLHWLPYVFQSTPRCEDFQHLKVQAENVLMYVCKARHLQ